MTFGILALRIWSLCLGPCSAGSGGSGVSGALGGPQSHLLHSFFSLSSYLYLGDVWHLGSEDLESLQVLGPCYLYAFLR